MPRRKATNATGYNGNPDLPLPGDVYEFTNEEVAEYTRCSQDPVYFITNYVKIVNVDKGVIKFNLYPFQQEMINHFVDNRFVICKLARQSGKAISLDTNILTDQGWSTMEYIQPGDRVYGADGRLTTVQWVSDVHTDHQCYRITFDNGETITADAEHQWFVGSSNWRTNGRGLSTGRQPRHTVIPPITKTRTNKVVTSQQLFHHITQHPRASYYVPVTKPLEFPEVSQPIIDPYTLGLWLGDGTAHNNSLTACLEDAAVYETHLAQAGYHTARRNIKDTTCILTIDTGRGFTQKLKDLGVFGHKHIPRSYLFGSVETRLALLQGLMDIDGSITKRGTCEFYQKSRAFIDDVQFLLHSLGIKTRTPRVKVINGSEYHTIVFTTTLYSVFRLPRKSIRQHYTKGHHKNTRLYITSIEPCESVPVKCLSVSNDDHLFLCGNTLIPTHNSTVVVAGYFLWYILFNLDVAVGIIANKETTAINLLDKLKESYKLLPRFLKQGVVKWDQTSIKLSNGARVRAEATSKNAARGDSFNILFLDEFAFVDENIATDFMSSVYPTISSGKTTKMFIVSTPNGYNYFHKLWKEAMAGINKFKPIGYTWKDVPGRDQEWADGEMKNLGVQKFRQEYDCDFMGSANSLIAAWKLEQLSHFQPLEERLNLKIYKKPVYNDDDEPAHVYIMVVDVGQGQEQDFSVFQIIDISTMPWEQVAVYRDNTTKPLQLAPLIDNLAKYYNQAFLFFEINAEGNSVAELVKEEYDYPNIIYIFPHKKKGQQISSGHHARARNGLKVSEATKRIGCTSLKSLIERDKLLIVDYETIRELTTFVAKMSKNRSHAKSYEAEVGNHDDTVMPLVNLGWLTAQQGFEEYLGAGRSMRMILSENEVVVTLEEPFIGVLGDLSNHVVVLGNVNGFEIIDDPDFWQSG